MGGCGFILLCPLGKEEGTSLHCKATGSGLDTERYFINEEGIVTYRHALYFNSLSSAYFPVTKIDSLQEDMPSLHLH